MQQKASKTPNTLGVFDAFLEDYIGLLGSFSSCARDRHFYLPLYVIATLFRLPFRTVVSTDASSNHEIQRCASFSDPSFCYAILLLVQHFHEYSTKFFVIDPMISSNIVFRKLSKILFRFSKQIQKSRFQIKSWSPITGLSWVLSDDEVICVQIYNTSPSDIVEYMQQCHNKRVKEINRIQRE